MIKRYSYWLLWLLVALLWRQQKKSSVTAEQPMKPDNLRQGGPQRDAIGRVSLQSAAVISNLSKSLQFTDQIM